MAVERRWTIWNCSKRFTVEKATASPIPLGTSVEVVPASDYDRLLSACKQWKQATESRLRLTDSRGEAAKSMLKPDADLVAVIQSCLEEGR